MGECPICGKHVYRYNYALAYEQFNCRSCWEWYKKIVRRLSPNSAAANVYISFGRYLT